jgi:hypothetical protein
LTVNRESPEQSVSWKPSSLSFVLAALLAAFMLFLGVRGFAVPVDAAKGFGLALLDAGDAVFVRIKAGRDLSLGLMLVALLVLRMRSALAAVVLAASVIPLVDCLVSITSDRGNLAYALMVHGSAVVYGLVLGALLLRASPAAAKPHAAR